MANFATVADMELVLQLPIVGDDKIAAAEYALTTVSAAIRNYCHQVLELVEDDEITLDSIGTGLIMLPELPVVDITSVTENGVDLVVLDDYRLSQYGILHRTGRRWYTGIGAVTVIYSHGYAQIPDAISTVCARAASRLYQAGLRAAETAGVPGVVSKQLGDFSVSFGAENTAEGSMGASGSRVLLLSEKDELDDYKL